MILNKVGIATVRQLQEANEKAARISEIFETNTSAPFFDELGGSVPENYNNYLLQYPNSVWVYACTYLNATTIAQLPWKLYKFKQQGSKLVKEQVFNQQIFELFNKPNTNDENSTWFNLVEWTSASLDLIGNSYWLLDDLVGLKPRSIQMLKGSSMRIIPGRKRGDDLVEGYAYIKVDSQKVLFTTQEITHFKYMSPLSQLYGQGSVSASRTSNTTHKYAQQTNLKIFQNGAKVDAVLETDKDLDDDLFKRLSSQFNGKYGTFSRSHQTAILTRGLKYKAIMSTLKDLEYINGLKITREEICAAFGVPPMLVGILDNASYSNFEEATKVFYNFNIVPKTKRLQSVITTVAKLFDKDIFFEFDLSDINALRDDEKEKSEIAKNYWSIGVPLNDIIDKMNLPFNPVDGGDVGLIPFSVSPIDQAAIIPEEEPIQQPEEDDEDMNEDEKSVKKTFTKEQKLFLWKQFDKLTTTISNGYMKIIDTFFSGLELSVIVRLNQKKDVNKAPQVNIYLWNENEVVDKWFNVSTKVHTASVKTNGQRELRNLGINQTFDVSNPRVKKYLKTYGLTRSVEVIGNARKDVIKALQAGVSAGESIPELTKRVQSVFIGYKDAAFKAERMARTEVIGASNFGALESYKQSGVVEKKSWLPEFDDRLRDTHLQAGRTYDEKGAIPVDESFDVGAGSGQAPGNIGVAEEDINCRCTLIPVVEK